MSFEFQSFGQAKSVLSQSCKASNVAILIVIRSHIHPELLLFVEIVFSHKARADLLMNWRTAMVVV
jgi:hypothetical protein